MDDQVAYEKIKEVVDAAWREKKAPILLTQLKATVSGAGLDLDTVLVGRKLKAFLEGGVGTYFHMTKPAMDTVGQQWMIGPLNVGDAEMISALTVSKRVKSSSEAPNTDYRFNLRIFTAFIKSLDQDKRRFLFLNDPPHFEDLDSSLPAPPNATEVDRRYIKAPDQEKVDSQITENLRSWATENNVPLEALRVQLKSSDNQAHINLATALRSLSQEELARISVPLDIVLKLIRG